MSGLKLIRQEFGYRQEDVARMIDISLSTMQKWEQGKLDINKANVGSMLKLSKLYFTSIEDLIKIGTGEMEYVGNQYRLNKKFMLKIKSGIMYYY